METTLKKREIQAGVRYLGYGCVNEYGEMMFTPKAVGSRAGESKLLKTGRGYSVTEMKHCLVVHVNLRKDGGALKMLKRLTEIVDELITVVRKYEL